MGKIIGVSICRDHLFVGFNSGSTVVCAKVLKKSKRHVRVYVRLGSRKAELSYWGNQSQPLTAYKILINWILLRLGFV